MNGLSMSSFDWSRIRFTEHMTEAAAVVVECQVVFDFGADALAPVSYDVQVMRVLKGASARPFFAVGTDRADPQGFRPLGEGDTAEEALDACLAAAGVYRRRLVKQSYE
jgi:hypothetical protein